LNVRPKAARLEVRKNFFSSRVTENWNKIPSHVKNVKTVSATSREVTKITVSWLLLPRGKKIWSTTRGRYSPRSPSGTTRSSSTSTYPSK
jgi:hypothetical protein